MDPLSFHDPTLEDGATSPFKYTPATTPFIWWSLLRVTRGQRPPRFFPRLLWRTLLQAADDVLVNMPHTWNNRRATSRVGPSVQRTNSFIKHCSQHRNNPTQASPTNNPTLQANVRKYIYIFTIADDFSENQCLSLSYSGFFLFFSFLYLFLEPSEDLDAQTH